MNEALIQSAKTLFRHSAAPGTQASADPLFERQWAETLVDTAVTGPAVEFEDEGKRSLFREMRVFVEGGAGPLPSAEEVGARLSMRPPAVRTQDWRRNEALNKSRSPCRCLKDLGT